MNNNNETNSNCDLDEWYKIIYSEAWNQYTHEDNLAQQRDSQYLTVISLIFSAIGVAITIFFSNIIGCDFREVSIRIVIYGIHLFIMIILLFVILLTHRWQKVTEAGQKYVSLRWKTAYEIEKHLKLEYTLAKSEDELRKNSSPKKQGFFGGFASTQSIIHVFRFLSEILVAIDIFSLIGYSIFLLYH